MKKHSEGVNANVEENKRNSQHSYGPATQASLDMVSQLLHQHGKVNVKHPK
jgi:hypothetical protein